MHVGPPIYQQCSCSVISMVINLIPLKRGEVHPQRPKTTDLIRIVLPGERIESLVAWRHFVRNTTHMRLEVPPGTTLPLYQINFARIRWCTFYFSVSS